MTTLYALDLDTEPALLVPAAHPRIALHAGLARLQLKAGPETLARLRVRRATGWEALRFRLKGNGQQCRD